MTQAIDAGAAAALLRAYDAQLRARVPARSPLPGLVFERDGQVVRAHHGVCGRVDHPDLGDVRRTDLDALERLAGLGPVLPRARGDLPGYLRERRGGWNDEPRVCVLEEDGRVVGGGWLRCEDGLPTGMRFAVMEGGVVHPRWRCAAEASTAR